MSISRARTASTAPPGEPGEGPRGGPGDGGEQGREHADGQRDPGAVRGPDEDVAAELVGAERERGAGPAGPPAGVQARLGERRVVGVAGQVRPQRRQRGERHDQREDAEGRDRGAVAAEPA
ncbi:hypothetical protein [Actinomadura madurae]|uniref:hypothetical protein n=1 Tax=Actinomadura madurae TaxID=1993 RepID=UPI0020D25D4B|nr:hypothetical protein [Actinomadura madurae]MCP9964617.1 hypothetical protein [Actinomadura madurae]